MTEGATGQDGRLTGRVAVITGGASGIGLGMVERFVAEGASVVAADIDSIVNELPDRLPGVVPATCDVSSEEDLDELAEITRRAFGKADVLCANAGVTVPHKPIWERTIAEWDRVMAVNLRGVFLSIKAFIPLMDVAGGGSIIITSSGAGIRPGINDAEYSVSKAGSLMLARAASLDLARKGIRVNAILPGATDTPLMRVGGSERMAEFAKAIPLGRLADSADIASMALFLATDQSSYVTGQGFQVDGGFDVGRWR
jgi:meso-butanediol dehydrogenase/(S,S)-butanediol dehydrogenase/diacetyl reductase